MKLTKKLKNAPKVSVIIPAYNQAHYISEAVHSVLEQTISDFELVVVNDGSTDETAHILSTLHDTRMRVIWQPNAGLSAARNTGIRESSAPLVTFLDADDYFMPDMLFGLMMFLDSHPEIGMVSGGIQTIDQEGHPLSQTIVRPRSLNLPELLYENPFSASSVMIRREWLDKVGIFDETLRACEDWDLWQRLANAGCRFDWIEQIVANYRYHPGQMTRESERMRKAIFSVMEKFFNQRDLPDSLRSCRNKAYASSFVHAAAYAYHASNFDRGRQDLNEAINLNPNYKENNYNELIGLLLGWAHDPRSKKPEEFLQRIIENLPADHPGLKKQLRRAIADIFLGNLYSSSREDRRQYKDELFKAIIYKPDCLFNRGVLRLIMDTLVYV